MAGRLPTIGILMMGGYFGDTKDDEMVEKVSLKMNSWMSFVILLIFWKVSRKGSWMMFRFLDKRDEETMLVYEDTMKMNGKTL